MNAPLLQLKKVHKSHVTPSGQELPVLRNLDLCVNAGESLAIVGPSGSGKSTLLHIMGCLDTPTQGTVTIDGKPTEGMSDNQLAAIRAEVIGFVFQNHHLLKNFTLHENLLMASASPTSDETNARAIGLLERVQLKERQDHYPQQCSGGECQRTALARALMNYPKLLLADEPTGSLDRQLSGEITELLLELQKSEGFAMVAVTHTPLLAQSLQSVKELENGQLKD